MTTYPPTEGQVFLADCGDPTHQAIFAIYDWGREYAKATGGEQFSDQPEQNVSMTISVSLNHVQRWWRRVWIALKYVFGHTTFWGHYADVDLQYKDIDRMLELLLLYSQMVDGYAEEPVATHDGNGSGAPKLFGDT